MYENRRKDRANIGQIFCIRMTTWRYPIKVSSPTERKSITKNDRKKATNCQQNFIGFRPRGRLVEILVDEKNESFGRYRRAEWNSCRTILWYLTIIAFSAERVNEKRVVENVLDCDNISITIFSSPGNLNSRQILFQPFFPFTGHLYKVYRQVTYEGKPKSRWFRLYVYISGKVFIFMFIRIIVQHSINQFRRRNKTKLLFIF